MKVKPFGKSLVVENRTADIIPTAENTYNENISTAKYYPNTKKLNGRRVKKY